MARDSSGLLLTQRQQSRYAGDNGVSVEVFPNSYGGVRDCTTQIPFETLLKEHEKLESMLMSHMRGVSALDISKL